MTRLAAPILVALLLAPAVASADAPPAPTRVADTPCAGCRASLPAGTDPAPLLVVLHGDWGHGPAEILSAWERHAAPRRVAVLALRCPRDQGCNGSFWKWNGDPSWLTTQVDALAGRRSIDRERVWLAGWSGGASYMGLRAQELQREFAALVYHGGGLPPASRACIMQSSSGAPRAAPVLFLAGTSNPLHHLAVRLRQHHERCNDEVEWRPIPMADHAAEWRALEDSGGAILDWLAKKRRSRALRVP